MSIPPTAPRPRRSRRCRCSTRVVRKLIEWRYERALRQFFLGNSVRVSEQQLPELWASYNGVCHILDMPDVYDLYVTSPVMGVAQAIGSTRSR